MKLCFLLLAAGLAFGQTTRYPGAVDDDSSLFVVKDNIQSSLTAAMAPGDTAAVVTSGTGFAPNMIVTICDTTTNTGKCTAWEHMLITAVSGNVLTVTRAFAGTAARSHSSGRLISALIDSAHQKVLKDSVFAIETALGPKSAPLPSPFPPFNTNPPASGSNWSVQHFWAGDPITNSIYGDSVVAYAFDLNIPATVTRPGPNRGAGFALEGTCQTSAPAATGPGCVAVGGFGYVNNVTSGPAFAWGADFQAGSVNFASNSILFGIEVDVNSRAAGSPDLSAKGVWVSGFTVQQFTADSAAVDVGFLGNDTKLPWKHAFVSDDGAAITGLQLGAQADSGTAASQTLIFRSMLSGTPVLNYMQAGAAGNGPLQISTPNGTQFVNAANGHQIFFIDAAGNTAGNTAAAKIGDTSGGGTAALLFHVNAATLNYDGAISINNGTGATGQGAMTIQAATIAMSGKVGLLPVAFASLGSVPAAGYQVFCSNCTTAATCASGGTGHVAVSNGSAWTCQ